MTKIELIEKEDVAQSILGAVNAQDFLGFVTMRPCPCGSNRPHLRTKLVAAADVDGDMMADELHRAAWRAVPKNQELPPLEGLITVSIAHVRGLQAPEHAAAGLSSAVVTISGDTRMCAPEEFVMLLRTLADSLAAGKATGTVPAPVDDEPPTGQYL